MIENWPSGPFDVVLADIPWHYYGSPTKMGAAGKHYQLMPDEEVLALPMAELLAPDGVLFCWATSPRLDFAVHCIEHWGLRYRGVGFLWVKTRHDGTVIGAQGPRASITKPTSELVLKATVPTSAIGTEDGVEHTAELVLSATRRPRGRPRPIADESVPQVILAPRGKHSEKPAELHRRVERLYPDAARLELFARRRIDGWQVWGDELA